MLFSRAIRLRNLQVGERLAMVPYADLINHSAFSQAFIDARESGDWLFKTGDEEVILYADRGYRQMEQVRIVQLQVIDFTCETILLHDIFVSNCQNHRLSCASSLQDLYILWTKIQR